MAETIDDLNQIHDKANELIDMMKAAQINHHLIGKTGNDHDDMSELYYAISELEAFVTDGLMPLKELQKDDESDDDDSDFYYEMKRDDAHEQRV